MELCRRYAAPPLLIRAARIGLQDYRREVHLRRLLRDGPLPQSPTALVRLLETEAALDQERRLASTGYSPARHVEVLIAMMAEARDMTPSLLET
ncbi:DUF6477 family protein [Roseovarius mucosus]|uniref:DUF6477 family protein n=1 Tax=Roseovarius mucosus TaxID=215743 RepID=UPI003F7159FD